MNQLIKAIIAFLEANEIVRAEDHEVYAYGLDTILYLRNMKRQREREVFFSDLSQAELDKLCVVDRYPSDSIVFSSHGYDLHIDNELVAEAFSTLPQMEQSILILHCTLDLADGEIGNLVGMSRSAVQRHRTKALQELRKALSALMPKGG